MEHSKAILDETPFGGRCVYRRFDDQVHGFMTARGDRAEPEVLEAVALAIDLLTAFFKACATGK